MEPIDISKIRWSGYGGYEGPVNYGSKAFILPRDPTFLQKCMSIVAIVEGHVDSVNMYDAGIVSLGTIQWIERGNMSVSDMMGAVAEKCGRDYVLQVLEPGLTISNADFRKNSLGRWRFFLKKPEGHVEVSSPELQKECFLGCSGKKGEWTPEATLRAKTWCASFARVWDNEDAVQAQLDFSGRRLLSWFVTPNAKTILFSDPDQSSWKGALKAVYVSFAVNSPAAADKNLVIANSNSKFPKWSREWCLDVIHQLVYGSQIAIWPLRYSGLVKRTNSLFEVDLPVSAKELAAKKWQEIVRPEPVVVPVEPSPPKFVPPPPEVPEVMPSPPISPPVRKPVLNDAGKSAVGIIVMSIIAVTTFFANFLDACGKK